MAVRDHVLIAGAGPVGLATALGLARRGIEVTVLERGDGPGSASRASTFHPPSLSFLEELEVVADVVRDGLRAPTFQMRDRRDGVIAEFDLGVLARETPYPYRVQLEQSKLCLLLGGRLKTHPEVTVRYDAAVEAVAQDDEGVEVVLASGDRIRGGWLVGADGAHSAVRRSLGIEHEGFTYAERFLVASTPVDLRELVPDLASVNYVSDPDEWLVLLQTPDHWRVLFPLGPDEALEDARRPKRLQERLQRVAPRDEPYPILQSSAYEIHQKVAARFRDRRVLLAGDAAHLNNPLGGLGMNSGLLDAWSLTRRLGDVVTGEAGEDDLDTYAQLRRRAALEVVDRQTRATKQRLEERDPAVRAAHHRDQAATAADPDAARAYLRRTTLLDTVPAAL